MVKELLEGLRVPRMREGDFHPKILPYRRRTSLERSLAILVLCATGGTPVTGRSTERSFLRQIESFLSCMQCAMPRTRKKDREAKAYALLAFLRHPKPIRRHLYTTNQLERLAKEVKRQTKVVEVFCGQKAVGKFLYLVLGNLNERLEGRLWGFAEVLMGSHHADQTH